MPIRLVEGMNGTAWSSPCLNNKDETKMKQRNNRERTSFIRNSITVYSVSIRSRFQSYFVVFRHAFCDESKPISFHSVTCIDSDFGTFRNELRNILQRLIKKKAKIGLKSGKTFENMKCNVDDPSQRIT